MTTWNMAVILKIMPDSPDTNLEAIKDKFKEILGEKAEIHTVKDEPIAFGLVAIELTILMLDKMGGLEEIEEKIRALDGVSDVEVVDMNRFA